LILDHIPTIFSLEASNENIGFDVLICFTQILGETNNAVEAPKIKES
jgi:hypothetical protein